MRHMAEREPEKKTRTSVIDRSELFDRAKQKKQKQEEIRRFLFNVTVRCRKSYESYNENSLVELKCNLNKLQPYTA